MPEWSSLTSSHADPARFGIQEIAARYSVSHATVNRWLQAGLPAKQLRPRSKVLIRAEDVETFLQDNAHNGKAQSRYLGEGR